MNLFNRLFGSAKAPELSEEERGSLERVLGPGMGVLGIGRGPGGVAVGTDTAFAVRRGGNPWEAVGWHEIQHGSWDPQSHTLSWELIDQTDDHLVLTEAGQLPGVFLAMVGHSIVVQQRFEVPGGRGTVIIAGRRATQPGAPISWVVQALGDTELADPVVHEFVVTQTDLLRLEYDFD